jgi:hypothetical protein
MKAVVMNTQAVHGTPITPKHLLQQMKGASFCVSYFRPDQLEDVIPLLGSEGPTVRDRTVRNRISAKFLLQAANADGLAIKS